MSAARTKVALVGKFILYASRRMYPDGRVYREMRIGMAPTEARGQSLFQVSSDLRDGGWLTITGLAASERDAINRRLRPVLFEAEALSSRMANLLYAQEAPASWYETLLAIYISLSPAGSAIVASATSASLQVTDHGNLAQLRGWQINQMDPRVIIRGPVAARSAREPGWQATLATLANLYDGQAKALLGQAMHCFKADLA